MKKLIGILGIVAVFLIALPNASKAQVYGEFGPIMLVTQDSYVPLDETDEDVTRIPADEFALPPLYATPDHDNGYYRIPIGFDFEYNGEIYDQLWINVNGFVTFGERQDDGSIKQPPFLPPTNPDALYIGDNSFPVNMIAPYFGDHYYRDENSLFQGFVPSDIRYVNNDVYYTDEDGIEYHRLIIEWNNLNINFNVEGEIIKSSIADFQVILYESTEEFSDQGNIEFAYGEIGDPAIEDIRVITKGAAIGIKGEGTTVGNQADFFNGLYYVQDPEDFNANAARTNMSRRSTTWPPSGATDNRIRFNALGRFNIEEFWGDGDVDFSKARGNRHFNMPQNRYVTVNDARLIIKSVATEVPLDPVRRRAAYHGDVNHNGRYYIDENGVRHDIPVKTMNYADSLPDELSSIKQLRFEANEYDASYILKYISGRVPFMPWLLDSIPVYGKENQDIASGLEFGELNEIYDNTYRVPVYLNGNWEQNVGFKLKLNGSIEDVSGYNNDDNRKVNVMFNDDILVVIGYGEFSKNDPVCYLTFKSNANVIKATEIRYNDRPAEDIVLSGSVNNANNGSGLVNVGPNPFNKVTNISVNIPENGNYEINIYNMLGNKVKNIHTGDLTSGLNNFEWNGMNSAGTIVEPGVYILSVSGNEVSESQKIILSK